MYNEDIGQNDELGTPKSKFHDVGDLVPTETNESETDYVCRSE